MVLYHFIINHQDVVVWICRISIVERNICSRSGSAGKFFKFCTVPQIPLAVFLFHFRLSILARFTLCAVLAYSFNGSLLTVAYPKTIFRDSPFCTCSTCFTVLTVGNGVAATVIESNSETACGRSYRSNPVGSIDFASRSLI